MTMSRGRAGYHSLKDEDFSIPDSVTEGHHMGEEAIEATVITTEEADTIIAMDEGAVDPMGDTALAIHGGVDILVEDTPGVVAVAVVMEAIPVVPGIPTLDHRRTVVAVDTITGHLNMGQGPEEEALALDVEVEVTDMVIPRAMVVEVDTAMEVVVEEEEEVLQQDQGRLDHILVGAHIATTLVTILQLMMTTAWDTAKAVDMVKVVAVTNLLITMAQTQGRRKTDMHRTCHHTRIQKVTRAKASSPYQSFATLLSVCVLTF